MTTTTFDVKGMTCGSCVRHIRHALSGIDGVRTVDVRLDDQRVTVAHEGASLPALLGALDDAGYTAQVTPE